MKRYIEIVTCLGAALTVLLVAACSSGDEPATDEPTAVNFSATVPAFLTRSIVNGTAGLQAEAAGFGVFAYYTGTYTWEQCDGSGTEGHTTKQAPNFMYNQQVQWDDSPQSGFWTYSPVKYWPNDNQPADDTGATGSQEHNYVSFFAYAPYNGTGLTPSLNTATGAPTIGYTWVSSTDPDDQHDLLYADPDDQHDLLYADPVTDCYKTMTEGYGTVGGRVPFHFRHALAAIEFKVRRKEASGDQILLQSLSLNDDDDATAASSSRATLNTSGTFNLGTPGWASFSTGTPSITYFSSDIYTALTASGTGVTATTNEDAHDLTRYTPNLLLLMPQEGTVTIPFTLSYTLGGAAKSPSGTITFTQPTGGWAIEMGRKYTVVFVIDGGEVESYLLRAKEAEQW